MCNLSEKQLSAENGVILNENQVLIRQEPTIRETYKKEFYEIPGYEGRYLMNRNCIVVDKNFNLITPEFSETTYRVSFTLDGKKKTYNQLCNLTFRRN